MRQLMMAMMACLLVGCGQSEHAPEAQSPSQANVLRTALPVNPMSLDPRIGGMRTSQVVVRMLFEGLMRITPDGDAQPALAQSVEVSDDGMVYTFHLRESFWSDGTPLTAHDFVYAWRKVLSPDFGSRYGYAFYPIKNAEAIAVGDLPLDALGAVAFDEQTLVVELEHPAPYILDHLANPVCAPVPADIDETQPRWCDSAASFVSNGPFRLVGWDHDSEIRLVRNEHYWDNESVSLDGVAIAIIDDARTSYALFEKGELDFLGEPFGDLPLEALPGLKEGGQLHTLQINGIYEYVFNCECFPFTSSKIRRAFAYALDREELVNNLLKGNEAIATSLVPAPLSLAERPLLKDGDREAAQQLFEEGLVELGISREEFPEVVITVGQLEGFKADERSLVLISPSMDRGVDLPEDLCRFVVLLKVPYPYLGDIQISRRLYSAKDGPLWYAIQTIRTIVQATGRGVRSEDDYCISYILDEQFGRLYREYTGMFPRWWRDALTPCPPFLQKEALGEPVLR